MIQRTLRYGLHFTLLVAGLVFAGGHSIALAADNPVRQWRTAHEREIVDRLFSYLALPNVARNDADISANARWLEQAFTERGFQVVLSDDAFAPVVFAQFMVPEARGSLLFYIHYDGQPVTPAEWTWCPPYSPCLVGPGGVIELVPDLQQFDPQWRIYARSASDDKAPLIALLSAFDALQATGQTPAWNIKVVLDGQEEAGSANFRRFLLEHQVEFAADLAITLDGPQHPSGYATQYFGVRGSASLTLTVHTASTDLHSGNYGNWAPDPSFRLAQLLGSMKAADGTVLIPGFYDQVTPLTDAEQAAIARMPAVEAALASSFGIAVPEMPDKRLEEKLNLPTLNVLAMDSGGGLGAPARTAIPAYASARLAMRLVNGIDPDVITQRVIDHIKAQGYEVVLNRAPTSEERSTYPLLAEIQTSTGRAATRSSLDIPIVTALTTAMTLDGIGPVQLPTLGGGLPFAEFSETLGMPTVGVPLVNFDNNQHAADENLKLLNLWQALELLANAMMMPSEGLARNQVQNLP